MLSHLRHRGPIASLAFVLIVAAAAHFSFYLAVPPRIWIDSLRYALLADGFWDRIAQRDWDLFTPPGYPFFLWAIGHWTGATSGVVLVQQLLAVLTCALVWIAVWWIEGTLVATLAGVAVALAPNRHYYAQCFLTETVTEFVLVATVAAVLIGAGARLPWLAASRAIAAIFVAAVVLARPNLAPFLLLFPFVVPRRLAGERQSARVLTAGGAGLLASLLLVPWLSFNASRRIVGFNGAVGHQLTGFLNVFGVGQTVERDLLHPHTIEADRKLRAVVLRRIRKNPQRYAASVISTLRHLLVPVRPTGDVGTAVKGAEDLPPESPLPGFASVAPRPQWALRLKVHAALDTLYRLLLPFSWVGLAWRGWRAAAAGDMAEIYVSAASFLSVVGLAAILFLNTRYTFPLEAVALAFGLPYLVSQLVRRQA